MGNFWVGSARGRETARVLWGAWLLLLVGVVAPPVDASGEGYPRATAPAGARLYILSPEPGASVSSPVTVRFGLAGMGVAPSGVKREGTGHHHLLLDTGLPPLDQPIPADENHIHFGGGQTETQIELAPGAHTLQLLLGDENHVPHDPPVVSEPIQIEVR